MLYASSKATLTKTLGQAQFTDSVYATQANELTLSAYKKHLESKAAGGPLTETEKMLAQVKMEEQEAEQIQTRRTPVASARVTAPIDDEAKAALDKFDKEGEKMGLAVLVGSGLMCFFGLPSDTFYV
jgi:twinfilin-like protein